MKTTNQKGGDSISQELEGFEEPQRRFETVKENWNKNPRIKKKVIDVAMRYNPNGGQ